MWKNILGLSLISIFLGLSGYSFVSGGYLVFNPEVRFVTSATQSIYLDDDLEAKTVLVYNANFDISKAKINSLCNIESTLLDSYKSLYFFEVIYANDPNCTNGNVVLQLGEEIYGNTIHKLNITKGSKIFDTYLDYADSDLEKVQDELQFDLINNAIFKNYSNVNIAQNFKYYKGQVAYRNAELHNKLITLILNGRKEKYLNPVVGREFSDAATKLPNSGRPYRAGYTDGIHHGFDIDGGYGDVAIALDTGMVVRLVEGFDNSDFSRIVYGNTVSEEQKLKNLDILRGNQVWIKTLKGDVVFYSHLDSVDEGIIEGELVKKGQVVGTTGVTGVPEEGYDDYHLHFAVMINPHNILRAGTYDFGEYMAWDWLGKGMSHGELIELRKNTFE